MLLRTQAVWSQWWCLATQRAPVQANKVNGKQWLWGLRNSDTQWTSWPIIWSCFPRARNYIKFRSSFCRHCTVEKGCICMTTSREQGGSWSSLGCRARSGCSSCTSPAAYKASHQMLSAIALGETQLKIPFEDGQAEQPGCPGRASTFKCLSPREQLFKRAPDFSWVEQPRREAWHQSGDQWTPCIYFQVRYTFKQSDWHIVWGHSSHRYDCWCN